MGQWLGLFYSPEGTGSRLVDHLMYEAWNIYIWLTTHTAAGALVWLALWVSSPDDRVYSWKKRRFNVNFYSFVLISAFIPNSSVLMGPQVRLLSYGNPRGKGSCRQISPFNIKFLLVCVNQKWDLKVRSFSTSRFYFSLQIKYYSISFLSFLLFRYK